MNVENTKVGLTGWLSPDGDFKESEYGHHHEYANQLLEHDVIKEEDKFIGMGSKGIGFEEYSYFFAPFPLTEKQKQWLTSNKHLLDETQLFLFELEHSMEME
jgi:hypothetical protein